MKIHRVALTTDFSSCSRQSFAPAADLARKLGAQLELVHCFEYPFQYLSFAAPEAVDYEAYRQGIRQELERVAKESVFAGLSPACHLLDGSGSEVISDYLSRESVDLLLQASHGYTGWKRFLLGSFAERVVRTAAVPVLTMKRTEADGAYGDVFRPERILFPYDFSVSSARAVEAVRLLARTFHSKVSLLHVWDAPLKPSTAFRVPAHFYEALSEQGIPDRLLGELKEFAQRQFDGIEHDEEVIVGAPAATILDRARSHKADLICMTTHGWTGLQHALLGSVAEKVLRGAGCPTLTVRPGPVDPSGG